jgi:uncharacterized protein with NAD-binding domain and iron-sulfur cluster
VSNTGRRKKIAILGGGVGAMTAACELTARPGWQDDYDVTVYQLGWRLGGKGASGRNLGAGGRIEEHGLHIWLGFYNNAFNLIRRCYEELNRPAGVPLATWQDAFKPQSFIVLEERYKDRLLHYPVEFLPNHLLPGEGGEPASVWEYVLLIIGRMHERFDASPYAQGDPKGTVQAAIPPVEKPHWWDRLADRLNAEFETVMAGGEHQLMASAHALANSLHRVPSEQDAEHRHALLWVLDRFLDWQFRLAEPILDDDEHARRLLVFLDLGCAAVRGMIRDRVIHNGFDSIDDADFRDWFRRHGAHELSMNSPWMWAFNDLAFAFRQGDTEQPDAAAGTTLRACLRMVFDYRGAFMWKMQAGMGDTIFAPMYEVLKKRGVKFQFFHRVSGLHPSEDGAAVDRISLVRQVTLKHGDYDPLVTVRDLPCWPWEPLYDQIVEGEALQRDRINLESFWTPWQGGEPVTLTRGVDFDDVVLGISLAGLPSICSDIIALKPNWQEMVDKVKTVRTQAFQLWLKPTLAELGWGLPSPVMTTYVEPLDTWADMSQLIDREDWGAGLEPGNVAYFCGPMMDSEEPPYFSDPTYPATIDAVVKARAIGWLEQNTRHLWPDAAQPGGDGLRWDLLIDPENRGGAGAVLVAVLAGEHRPHRAVRAVSHGQHAVSPA